MFIKDSNGSITVQSTQLSNPILVPIAEDEVALFKVYQNILKNGVVTTRSPRLRTRMR